MAEFPSIQEALDYLINCATANGLLGETETSKKLLEVTKGEVLDYINREISREYNRGHINSYNDRVF